MKRFVPLILLLAAGLIASCKSTGVNVLPTTTHGIDAQGNVWMTPPPAGEGIQIAVEPFVVPDSAEVQGNFYLTLPKADLPLSVGRIEIAMNDGTHHMNLYRWRNVWPADSGVPRPVIYSNINGKLDTISVRYQAQFNALIVRNNGDMMVEAQVPYLNWTFPTLPDGSQSAVEFNATDSTLVIENHYVNIAALNGTGSQTTPNGYGKVIINLWKPSSGNLTQASMMFAREVNLKIPPHSDSTFYKDCTVMNTITSLPSTVYILGMTGHYHSRGKQFWVDKMKQYLDSKGNTVDSLLQSHIYQSASWDEPPFTAYPTPIPLNLSQGEFIRYHAEYVNTTDQVINFGAHVATQEHMNLFMWFAPSWNQGQTIYDDQP